jgi:thiol-disulfide isomerase/thioredoxin
MANAGHLAVRGDTLYYAPFIRDELIAMTATGDTLWRATRDLPQSTAEPRFEIHEGEPVVDYHPVNLGLTFGPDGLLYLLSTPGFTTSESRLDVYQPATGTLVRTAHLTTALPSLAVNPAGRLYQFDDFRLLSGVAVADREAFPPFDLELIGGGSMHSDQLRGRVTLINVWASWCEPCREEMPALDSLQRSIDDPTFRFITLNEDVDPDDAADFLDEFGFTFPAALGRGNMKSVYHYRGLPLTLLIDREGQIVQQWIGYAGPDQLAVIRTVIDAELARVPDGNDPSAHAGMHH